MKKFELLEHTGDIKIRVYGTTLEELFSNAVYGMFASISPHQKSDKKVEHVFTVQADSLEILLINFLSECLYLSDIHNEAYDAAQFTQLIHTNAQGTLYGYPISGFERVEIKAVTYHDTKIEQINDIWQATIVFDI